MYLNTRENFSLFSLFVLFSLFSSSGLAQTQPLLPHIEAISPSAYNGHPQIFCTERDSLGGMWFGTSEEILHYQGERWEKIPTSPGMSVLSLDMDKEGRLWVGGQGEFGYLRVLPHRDTDSSFLGNKAGADTISSSERDAPPGSLEYVSLTHLLPDSLRSFKNVWCVHAMEKGVYFNAGKIIFYLRDGRIYPIRPPHRAFYRSHVVDGELWVQDRGNALYRTSKEEDMGLDQGESPSLEKLPGSETLGKKAVISVLDRIPGMTQEGDQEAIVVTGRDGLYRYTYGPLDGEGKDERIRMIGKEGDIPRTKVFHATPLEPEKNPWDAALAISTSHKGVILFDTTGGPIRVLDQRVGMTADYVWKTVKGDPGSGILWSATNKGITKWGPGDPRTYSREGKAFSGLLQDVTDYKGRIFIATGQGVYVLKEKGIEGNEWSLIEGTGELCTDLYVTGNSASGSQSLLVSQGSDLLEIRAGHGKKGEGGRDRKAHEINGKYPFDITGMGGSHNRQWVAFGGRKGIVVLSRENEGEWRERIHIQELPDEVLYLEASFHEEKKEHSLWVGFRKKGGFLLRFDSSTLSKSIHSDDPLSIPYKKLLKERRKGMKITSFEGKVEDRKGLPKGPVRIFPYKEGVLAGTRSGLFRPELKEGASLSWVPDSSFGCRFGKCSQEKADGPQAIFRFHEAPDGTVWINSDGWLYHIFSQEEEGIRVDSLPFKGIELGVARAIHSEKDGVTWIGGDNGVVRYDEDVKKRFQRSYPCYIKKVSVSPPDSNKQDSTLFGGFYRVPAPQDPLLDWKRVQEQPDSFTPTLPYVMNGLTFRFASPFYEKQEKVEYSYRLFGFEEQWSQWDRKIRKEYTNLPEGDYSFKVKARNVYGVESELAVYRFRILPPWYRSWTAYGGYTFAGLGLIWLLLWLNSRRLIAHKQRLERIVQERTKEIQEQQKETEKQKEEAEKQRALAEEQKEQVELQQKETEKKKEALEEANRTISKQKDEVEEAHREITASIDYAQKIQNALLQTEEYASDHLPEHFILFKPQATVSGDFYWAKERNGYLYFAAIDCTGHGVPGAFMSMLGINQLNEIMAAKELPSPGEVLTDLRDRVVAELRSGDPEGGAKDGMDAAIVKIPISKSQAPSGEDIEVQFAGAQNPLYVVRKGIAKDDLSGLVEGHVRNDRDRSVQDRLKAFKKSSDGIEIKGDPMPVGYNEYTSGDFTTFSLRVQKGDMLYMFSDGYADQFGGPKGKKFRYGPFKKLLADLHERSVAEQKQELDRVFEDWKAESEQEQIDDVVVVGVRV